jgi:hypothetical protein
MQQMAQDKSPAGVQKLQETMQQNNMIKDVLRSSGYARANNAFALMFHSGDLQGQDRLNFGKTGVALLNMASKFDPSMMGPPPDANFMKHYDAAMNVVMGAPRDQQPAPGPRPGDQTQPPKPGDQTQPPKPGDQTQPPKPGDQTQPPKPGDQTQPAPGGNVSVDGNQYYVNYRGLHVPTWTQKNPDGSATKPFTTDGAQPRNDGMLKPVTDNQGRVLGMDGQPLMDGQGMRRIGDNGLPVPAQFDASDPALMLAKLEPVKTLDDASRAAYNKVIESADKLDRVSIAKAIETNEGVIKQNQQGFQWESQYRQLNQQLGKTFSELGQFRQGLNQGQLDGLNKMWEAVKTPQDIDKWINDPANKASKDALTADPQKWAAIKSKYGEYLNKESEVRAKEKELTDKPDLADQVRKVRAADSMNQELARLFASSVDARAGYMAKLLDQDNVKKFMTTQDKNSPDAKNLANDANVKEAQRVIVELAKCNPQLAARLGATGAALGVDLSKAAAPADAQPKPADQTQPKPADQTQPKPADQTQPKPADQTQPKPADQTQPKPADQTQPKPADQTQPKPADQTQRTADKLSDDQANSPQVLNGAYMQYLQGTENATKAMKKEDFDKLAPAWEKALEANASIKPEQIAAYEKQAQDQYANQTALALALAKSGKQSFDQLVPDDLNKVTQDELKKSMTDSVAGWMNVQSDMNKALNALKPEDKQKYSASEQKFQAAMTQAQKDAGNDQNKLQQAYQAAYTTKINEQKALDPNLAKAIDARAAFLNDSKGVFAKQYAENMQLLDSYKHVDEARIQYAQALALQGGDDNKAKASKLIADAMKNPEAAKLLQGTQDGQKLLTDLKLRTPDMQKLQDDQDKLFPEMKLARDATEVSATNWKDADAKFKAAEAAIDKEIMDKGQGKDVAESLAKVNQNIESMKMQLGMAIDDFKNGRRNLPDIQGQTAEQKASDTKIVQDAVKNMNQLDMVQALMGSKGPQLQAAMQRVLTDAEKTTLNNMAVLAQKAQNVSLIRMQHALKASEYGFKHNDDAAKADAKSIVEGIAKVDPQTFTSSPEVIGALKQAEQNRQMDVSDGKAATIAFSEAAKDTITKTQQGLVDWVVPGASLGLNSAAVATTGHYVSEIPFVGGLFGGSKEATNKLVDQLAMAQLSNAAEAQAQRDQTVKDGHTQLRGLAGDVTGVGATFLSGWGINKGLQAAAEYAPLPGWARFGLSAAGGLAVGGLTNNAVSGNDLLSSRGYLRNTVAAGTTYAAIKGLEYLPGNRTLTLTGETAEKLGLAEGTQITGSQLGKSLAAETAAASGDGKFVQFARSLSSRLNPTTLTPFRLGELAEGASRFNPLAQLGRIEYAGYGGARTVELLANGTMNLAEYNARQFAAKTLGTFAIGYGFGAANKGAAILSGEHLDGKSYNTFGDYWHDMNTAGLQTGLASSFLIPVVGKAMVPNSWQAGVGRGVTNLFGRLPGVDAQAAAGAFGSAALMWTRPTLDASSRWGEATIYDNIYERAKVRAQELRNNAAQQLQGGDKQGDKK